MYRQLHIFDDAKRQCPQPSPYAIKILQDHHHEIYNLGKMHSYASLLQSSLEEREKKTRKVVIQTQQKAYLLLDNAKLTTSITGR